MLRKHPRVFVVHGHDKSAKRAVVALLKQLKMKPILLEDQPNRGRSLIQKLEVHSKVDYAVVLFTPDDLARAHSGQKVSRPRARQNVVFELGYFTAKLKTKRVCLLYRNGVEIPSDFSGIGYVEMSRSSKWRQRLAHEIQKAGVIKVNPNRILQADSRRRPGGMSHKKNSLEIYHKPGEKGCWRRKDMQDNNVPVWRVGVVSPPGAPPQKVKLILASADGITDLPKTLHPMSSKGTANGWEGDGSFDLWPDLPEYVDVLRYTESSKELNVVLQHGHMAGMKIELKSYTFLIKAQTPKGASVTKSFRFEVNPDGSNPRFFEVS